MLVNTTSSFFFARGNTVGGQASDGAFVGACGAPSNGRALIGKLSTA